MARHIWIGSGTTDPTTAPTTAGDRYVNTANGRTFEARRNAEGTLFWMEESVGRVRGWASSIPAATLSAGGMTLTANANGSFNGASPGGIGTWLVGDRVGVGDSAGAVASGVYVVAELGNAGAPWVLVRAADARDQGSLYYGRRFVVTEGDEATHSFCVVAATATYTVGVSGLGFIRMAQFPVKANMMGSDSLGATGVVGVGLVFEFAITPGVGAVADDVALFTTNAPFPFEVVRTDMVVSAISGGNVQLRTGVTALSGTIDTTALGFASQAPGGGYTAPATVPPGGSMSLHRSDNTVGGTLIIHARAATI